MKKILIFFLFSTVVVASCSSSVRNVFNKKTAHEKYSDKHEDSPEGRAWIAASVKALDQPVSIQLPYRQYGSFVAGKARALGLEFNAKQGERISFELEKAGEDQVIFADIFEKNGSREDPVYSAGLSDSVFVFDASYSGTYILRLQPQLNQSTQYNLGVSSGPSLGFPVAGNKAKTGSFWGASRDGGKRSHEGIDIFAPKRTPVIASEDGFVTGVREGGIGGKVVWQRVSGKNISLYYAHLDKQLVREGQYVKKGDTLGLVGNTGNAKHTPSHLHFGIYTFGGPVDPFPFVNPAIKKAPELAKKDLRGMLKLEKQLKATDGSSLDANTLLVPLGINAKGYIAELPDGNMIIVPFSNGKIERNVGFTTLVQTEAFG